MKKIHTLWTRSFLLLLVVCTALLTGCSSSQPKEAPVTSAAPFETFMEENQPSGMEEVDSELKTFSVTYQDGVFVSSEDLPFQAKLYTYLAPKPETDGDASEPPAQTCTVLADIEFVEKVTITSDCYLKISLDDQVSPVECNGLLYYRDSPDEDWTLHKEQTGQPFLSFTDFTFLGSELKKDNRPHYYRLMATTKEADYYPTNNSQSPIRHTVIFYQDIPVDKLTFSFPHRS